MQHSILFKRIFYLEPFLIKAERHFIETTLAIDRYLSKQSTIYYIVGNRNLEDDIMQLFPKVINGISQTCFESLNDYGESFYKDLLLMHREYGFSSNDLLIIPTAYENQILGVAKYFVSIKNHIKNSPKIALQFHQLFPPVSESDDVSKLSFRRFWIKRLRGAFKKINNDSISYWTTESKKLNRDFQRISNRHVGMLPVPYLVLDKNIDKLPIPRNFISTKKMVLAFLGEGRQEKGLLYLLKAIEYINRYKNSFVFLIQNMNPRGYSENQKKEFDILLTKISRYKNIIIINGGIPPLQFHSLLRWIDGVVLPYNPINYHRRVAGLLIHASIYKKPAIVSSGTWASYTLKKKWASGLIFEYNQNSEKKIISNLIKNINLFVLQKENLFKLAEAYSHYFRTYNTGEEYLKRIFFYYGEKT